MLWTVKWTRDARSPRPTRGAPEGLGLVRSPCGRARPGRVGSPLAHDLAGVAGALQQLRQQVLWVRDAAHDLLWRVGCGATQRVTPRLQGQSPGRGGGAGALSGSSGLSLPSPRLLGQSGAGGLHVRSREHVLRQDALPSRALQPHLVVGADLAAAAPGLRVDSRPHTGSGPRRGGCARREGHVAPPPGQGAAGTEAGPPPLA